MLSRTRRILPALIAALAVCAAMPASAQNGYTLTSLRDKIGFTPFNVFGIAANGAILADNQLISKNSTTPLPDPPGLVFTTYTAVNSAGTTTGYGYLEDFSDSVAFVRRADGSVRILPFPAFAFAGPTGINESETVVGTYYDENFLTHGFVADKQGSIRTIDVPGSVVTIPMGINASGVIVGYYYDQNFAPRAFVLDKKGFHDLVVPGADYAIANSINSRGEIAGGAQFGNDFKGFVLSGGKVKIVDYTIPNAPDQLVIDFGDGPTVFNIWFRSSSVSGINERGEIVGTAAALYLPEDPNIPFFLILFDSFYGEPSK